MINLIKNAFKFTRSGVIRVLVAYDYVNQKLNVHVVDTGKGIKAEDMTHLFTQFGKLLRTADMNHEGIGMGLMLCETLVRQNQGSISAHSDGLNHGSCFTFTYSMLMVDRAEEGKLHYSNSDNKEDKISGEESRKECPGLFIVEEKKKPTPRICE